MSAPPQRPVIVLAFANDRQDGARYLRNLPEEHRRVRKALSGAVRAGLCEVVERAGATLGDLLDVLQDPSYRDRIAIFHFGGHAGSDRILLEDEHGARADAHAKGIAELLGKQRGLELVFINGCSSQNQAKDLLAAGVSAVIGTNQAIDDDVATLFSERFYAALSTGASMDTAFAEATAAGKAKCGDKPAQLYRDLEEEVPELLVDHWPWMLHFGPGAEAARGWSLPLAAGDPLFGLPPLPVMDLPTVPYRHLKWYTRDEAEVFFGRGQKIRALYQAITAPDNAPLILFYGPTGAGKSSLIEAGLLPRLEHTCDVLHTRREGTVGLTGALAALFEVDAGAAIRDAWVSRERGAPPTEPTTHSMSRLMAHLEKIKTEQGGDPELEVIFDAVEEVIQRKSTPQMQAMPSKGAQRPLVVVLDQVEEAFTRPRPDDPDEFQNFLEALSRIFSGSVGRPMGRLVLSFRKEWLAEIRGDIQAARIPFVEVELRHLGHSEILEAIEGITRSDRLRRAYGLKLESGLAGVIADDLLEDRGAAIAPTLQILLTRLWERACESTTAEPAFTIDLYQEMKKEGLLIKDFIDQQLSAIQARHPEAIESGLVLDILARHTTALGTAQIVSREALNDLYSHRDDILPTLLQHLQDLYLLTSQPGHTRLAHDTLAPIVRQRYEASDWPGQRAARIFSQRIVDWRHGRVGHPLDSEDLGTVEGGSAGMRVWDKDEQRLVEVSRNQRHRRERFKKMGLRASVLAAFSFAALALFAQFNAQRAEDLSEFAIIRAAIGQIPDEIADGHHKQAGLLAIAAWRLNGLQSEPQLNDIAAQSLRTVVDPAIGSTLLDTTPGPISDAAFSPDGKQLATTRKGTIDVWTLGNIPALSRTQKATDPAAALRAWRGIAVAPHAQKLIERSQNKRVTFSPNGRWLSATSKQGTTEIFDLDQPETPARNLGKPKLGCFCGSDETFLIGDGRTISSIVLADPASAPETVFKGRIPFVNMAANRSRTQLALVFEDHSILLVSLSGQRRAPLKLTGHRALITHMAFAPDNSALVSRDAFGKVRVWQGLKAPLVEPNTIMTGASTKNTVLAAFRDERLLMTVNADGRLDLWGDSESQHQRHKLDLGGRTITAAALSPDRSRLVVATDRTITVVETSSPFATIATIKGSGKTASALALGGPKGAVLGLGEQGGCVLAAPVASGATLKKLWCHKTDVQTMVFGSKGEQLYTKDKAGAVYLHGPIDGSKEAKGVKTGVLGALPHGLSMSGDFIVDFGSEGKVALAPLSLASVAPFHRYDITRDQGTIRHVNFDPSSPCRLAFSTLEGMGKTNDGVRHEATRLWMWDARTLLEDLVHDEWDWFSLKRSGRSPVLLGEIDAGLEAVAFSPDGDLIAVVRDDGKINAWRAREEELVEDLCRHIGRDMSASEWDHLIGDSFDRIPICPPPE